MKVLDPFEVYQIEVWPMPEYQGRLTSDAKAKAPLNWLEFDIYQRGLKKSHFGAVLNEKEPPKAPNNGYQRPKSWR